MKNFLAILGHYSVTAIQNVISGKLAFFILRLKAVEKEIYCSFPHDVQ
jgi:hypothetical protein